MRIAITGATGNVGTSCLLAFAAEPRVSEIIGIARRRPVLEFPRTRFISADVAKDDLRRWFDQVDVVIHLAWDLQPAHDEPALFRNNVAGSVRVFEAAVRAGVKAIVCASSVAVYSPARPDEIVDEAWPREGVLAASYSTHKVQVEKELDALEARHPNLRIVRLRPAFIFKRDAASHIERLFLGRFYPRRLLKPGSVPPVPEDFHLQCVHSLDVGKAIRRSTTLNVRGAFNLAAEPVLGAQQLATLLESRTARIKPSVVRALAAASFRLRLQPSEPGWVDLAFRAPVVSSERARSELGWEPFHDATETLMELLNGIREGSGIPTPPLVARRSERPPAELPSMPAKRTGEQGATR